MFALWHTQARTRARRKRRRNSNLYRCVYMCPSTSPPNVPLLTKTPPTQGGRAATQLCARRRARARAAHVPCRRCERIVHHHRRTTRTTHPAHTHAHAQYKRHCTAPAALRPSKRPSPKAPGAPELRRAYLERCLILRRFRLRRRVRFFFHLARILSQPLSTCEQASATFLRPPSLSPFFPFFFSFLFH